MMKTWEASIQRSLERREKTTVTVQNLQGVRGFAKRSDEMFEECGLELHSEAIAQIKYITA